MTDNQAKQATMKEMADWRCTILAQINKYRNNRVNTDVCYKDEHGNDRLYCRISNCILPVPDESVLEIVEACQKQFGNAYIV